MPRVAGVGSLRGYQSGTAHSHPASIRRSVDDGELAGMISSLVLAYAVGVPFASVSGADSPREIGIRPPPQNSTASPRPSSGTLVSDVKVRWKSGDSGSVCCEPEQIRSPRYGQASGDRSVLRGSHRAVDLLALERREMGCSGAHLDGVRAFTRCDAIGRQMWAQPNSGRPDLCSRRENTTGLGKAHGTALGGGNKTKVKVCEAGVHGLCGRQDGAVSG